MKPIFRFALIGAITLAAGSAAAQAAAAGCGGFPRADNGPFDYRTQRGYSLKVVESNHFTPKVEALIAGQTSETPGGDLDFTLRAFPNHHRALLSTLRFAEKTKVPKHPEMTYSFECYFERAVRFSRDDPIARMLYATFLGDQGRIGEAKAQLEAADRVADNNPFTFYNIGMVYADLKQYDSALEQAHKAYKLGFRQPGLRDRLKAAGQWREPG